MDTQEAERKPTTKVDDLTRNKNSKMGIGWIHRTKGDTWINAELQNELYQLVIIKIIILIIYFLDVQIFKARYIMKSGRKNDKQGNNHFANLYF